MGNHHSGVRRFGLNAFENLSAQQIPATIRNGNRESPSSGLRVEGLFGEEFGSDQIQSLMNLDIELVGLRRRLNGPATKEETIINQMPQPTDRVADRGLAHVKALGCLLLASFFIDRFKYGQEVEVQLAKTDRGQGAYSWKFGRQDPLGTRRAASEYKGVELMRKQIPACLFYTPPFKPGRFEKS